MRARARRDEGLRKVVMWVSDSEGIHWSGLVPPVTADWLEEWRV